MSNEIKYNALLNPVADSINSDDRSQARAEIEKILEQVGDEVESWLIHAWTCDSLSEAEISLQRSLEIDPGNGIAIAGLNWINGIREIGEDQRECRQRFEEQERRRKEAEEEARAKAEEEARAKAEEEARVKAEEEARIKAEEEARVKAEEEARAKAEEQAKLQAEEARLRNEEEARARAESTDQPQAAETPSAVEPPPSAPTGLFKLSQTQPFCVDDLANDQPEPSEPTQPVDTHAVVAELAQSVEVESEIKQDLSSLANELRQRVQTEVSEALPPAAEKPAESQKTTMEDLIFNQGEKPVILAVDDSPTIRKLVSLTLSSEGFEVITACDGIEALSILAERLPDLILSDINMPKLGGYKLCKFVKKHERTQSIPVVMLSGKDGVFDKMRGKLNGCDDFLGKPFEPTELLKKVRDNLVAARI